MMRTHCQTSGVSLTGTGSFQQYSCPAPTLEALAAILGGTQSLHTNAFDEAIALANRTHPRAWRAILHAYPDA